MTAHEHGATEMAVLMPFYNAASTLGETLDTIQGQTLSNFTLIAVDDGSNDNSATIVRQRMQHDPRIQLLQPGRQGVVGAMNSALAHCRSPTVARMDADDLMEPERLEKQLGFLKENPEIDLVGSRVSLFPEELILEGFYEYIRWQNSCITPEQIAHNIYVELPIAHPSVMFRRKVVMDAGGYRDGDFPEDYELLLRLHQRGHQMAKLPETLLHWRDSGERLTRTDGRYRREAFDIIRARYLAQDPRLKQGRPLVFWGAGRKTRKRIAHLLQHGHRSSAWIDIDPNKIGNTIDDAPVVSPQWLEQREKPFVLSYVSNHGARELIAKDLRAMGYVEGKDYLMVG
ncbi:MAG: glycosyltransferase [Gammaproteobacteria bacterium]|nr:glycosyltransferase [Gammaproteobacteria bacterium]